MQNNRYFLHTAVLAPAVLMLVAALPVTGAPMDSRIESSIKNSYNFKTYLVNDDISVKSSNGMVILTGTVNENFHKTLAEETALDASGVKSVKNELQVKNGEPTKNSDAWITMKVKGALAFNKNVSAMDTNVETQDGVVTLRGKAKDTAQKELATEYAKDVDGVKEVNNLMTIGEPSSAPTIGRKIDDASITAQIKTALLFRQSTHMLSTKVTTQNGVVTLRGEVKNDEEKTLVGKMAEDTPGVKNVKNLIVVNPTNKM